MKTKQEGKNSVFMSILGCWCYHSCATVEHHRAAIIETDSLPCNLHHSGFVSPVGLLACQQDYTKTTHQMCTKLGRGRVLTQNYPDLDKGTYPGIPSHFI